MQINIRREGGHGKDRNGRMTRFSYQYSWQTPDDIDWPNYSGGKPDGTFRPGPRAGSYVSHGTSLAELRAMLKRKFGRDVVITETWKVAA